VVRSIEELVRIAVAGGGFTTSAAPYTTEQLVRLAGAAGGTGSRIHLLDLADRPTADLVRIALAGDSSISFEL
jgi:DNA replication protein